MTALLSILLAAASASPAEGVPSGFRAYEGGIRHDVSGVLCPDLLQVGEVAFKRSRATQVGWRASCIYVNRGEAKVSAAFSVEIAPVPGAPVEDAESDKMLDVTALLMTRNAPAEAVTQVGTGVVRVRRGPETGKVERHVATRRGRWMVNYSGVSTPARETSLAEAIDAFARGPLDTSSSFASRPE